LFEVTAKGFRVKGVQDGNKNIAPDVIVTEPVIVEDAVGIDGLVPAILQAVYFSPPLRFIYPVKHDPACRGEEKLEFWQLPSENSVQVTGAEGLVMKQKEPGNDKKGNSFFSHSFVHFTFYIISTERCVQFPKISEGRSMKKFTACLLTMLLSCVEITCPFQICQAGGSKMKLTSPEFEHNEFIPTRFTCQGEDISPDLAVEDVPEGTASLVLMVDDPDAPVGTWLHWLVFDIPVISKIEEGSVPGKPGRNDFRRLDYGGPCPPSGTHRYFFRLYALDRMLNLKEGISRKDLEKAMEGHVLAKAELIGRYKKQ